MVLYDAFTLAVIAIGAGAIFGAVNDIFGWLKSNMPFDARKFAITVLTGIGAGIVLVFTQINGIVEATNNFELLMALAGLAFAIFGVNFVRTSVSQMIANRAVEQSETL